MAAIIKNICPLCGHKRMIDKGDKLKCARCSHRMSKTFNQNVKIERK